jgi:hypothetical protein
MSTGLIALTGWKVIGALSILFGVATVTVRALFAFVARLRPPPSSAAAAGGPHPAPAPPGRHGWRAGAAQAYGLFVWGSRPSAADDVSENKMRL